eukprot:3430256-Rhodomonas_salina.1
MVVQLAAKTVQEQDKWQSNLMVSNLKFGCQWTKYFLERYGMRRKRVTADCKGTLPSNYEILEVLQGMQQIITENKIAPKFTLNTDKTGLFYGQGPKNLTEVESCH